MYNYQLETLIKAADCGSFSKAAEKLYISPTAVMKQIDALERRVGAPLFNRTNRGITLTSAGESLYKDAKFIIEYSNKAICRAREMSDESQYLIRVGTSFLNPCKLLMDLWAEVSDVYPQFKIKIIPFDDDRRNILSTISSLGYKFDLIAGVCDSKEWLKRCRFFPLGEYNFCIAAPKKHRLAEHKELNLKDLHGERLMMIPRGDSPRNDAVRDKIEKEHPQIQIEDTPYFYDMDVFNKCEQTGSLLLTLDGWKDIHPALITIPLSDCGSNTYGLLYAKKASLDVEEFLKAVTSVSQV